MHKHLSLSLIILVFIIFTACSADDVIPGVRNTLTLNGQTFQVTTASITGVAIDNEGHAGISFTQVSNTVSKTLTIDIDYTGNSQVAGKYSYPLVGTDKYLDDFLTSYTEISITSNGTISNATSLSTGSVTIQHNGANSYTVSIDLVMEDGKEFKGSYSGSFLVAFNNG